MVQMKYLAKTKIHNNKKGLIMKNSFRIALALLAVTGMFSLTSCESESEKELDKAVKAVEKAGQEAAKELEKAAKEAQK